MGGIAGKLVHYQLNPLHSTLIPLRYSSTETIPEGGKKWGRIPQKVTRGGAYLKKGDWSTGPHGKTMFTSSKLVSKTSLGEG
jgi:hypothetical protein